MPDFVNEPFEWNPEPAATKIEHQHRMQYDSLYREAMNNRLVKRTFLERICAALDGPMSEYLKETFGNEVEVPDYEW